MSARLPVVKPAPDGWWLRGIAPVAWEAVVEILETTGEPWPEEVVIADLAYWTDAAEQGRAPRVPSHRVLMLRWRWSEWSAREIMRRALTPASQRPHSALTAPSHGDRSKLDNNGDTLTAPSHEPHMSLAETSTRALRSEEEEEEEEHNGADGPASLPAEGPEPVEEQRTIPLALQAPSKPEPDPVEIVAAEWWRWWQIRRLEHPRNAPRSPRLRKEDRAAIEAVVGGRKPKLSVQEAIMICRWAFYGNCWHAKHTRGEHEGQVENEYLTPVSAYKPTKLGEKLSKARPFIEEREARRAAAAAAPPPRPPEPVHVSVPIDLRAPDPKPTPAPPPELDPVTAARLAEITARRQAARRAAMFPPPGEFDAQAAPTDG